MIPTSGGAVRYGGVNHLDRSRSSIRWIVGWFRACLAYERGGASIRPVNNLDAVRLLAALAVIVGHSFTLTGVATAPRILGIPIHSLGLYTFFAISGYLIAKSWNRDPRLLVYLASRSLRIFPALVVLVFITVFLIGPVTSVLGLSDYFRGEMVWRYVLNIALLAQYDLPGVFDSGHRTSAVNGVLWTLGLEFACYLVVAIVGVALSRGRGRGRGYGYLAFGVIALTFALAPAGGAGSEWMSPAGTTWVFFAVGALLSLAAGNWFSVNLLAGVVVVWVAAVALWPSSALVFAWLALPYTVLVLGLMATPGIRSAGRFGDFSYGLYLWGFLVQQLVIEWFDALPWVWNTTVVIIVTGAIACTSWHVVEKRALTLKARIAAAPTRAQGQLTGIQARATP